MHPKVITNFDADLQDALRDYMKGYAVFDYISFKDVWDLRDLGFKWRDLESWIGGKLPKNHQGFPRLQGVRLSEKLLALAEHAGVRRPQ